MRTTSTRTPSPSRLLAAASRTLVRTETGIRGRIVGRVWEWLSIGSMQITSHPEGTVTGTKHFVVARRVVARSYWVAGRRVWAGPRAGAPAGRRRRSRGRWWTPADRGRPATARSPIHVRDKRACGACTRGRAGTFVVARHRASCAPANPPSGAPARGQARTRLRPWSVRSSRTRTGSGRDRPYTGRDRETIRRLNSVGGSRGSPCPGTDDHSGSVRTTSGVSVAPSVSDVGAGPVPARPDPLLLRHWSHTTTSEGGCGLGRGLGPPTGGSREPPKSTCAAPAPVGAPSPRPCPHPPAVDPPTPKRRSSLLRCYT